MRRRRIFLLIFGILIMILVIGLILLWRRRGGESLTSLLPIQPDLPVLATPVPEATPEIETEPIVVAVQSVPRGTTIPPDAVEIREWPKTESFPENPARELSEVVGKVARRDLVRQRPVLKSAIAESMLGSGAEMALDIPKGKVAYAMPVRILSAVANAIKPGDRVDILLSFSMVDVDQDSQIRQPLVRTGGEDCLAGCQPSGTQIPRLVSQYSVQNATILSIGIWEEEEPAPAPTPEPGAQTDTTAEATPVPPSSPSVAQAATRLTSITLIVSPQDALVLKWALESNASVDLVMRSAIDQDIYAQPEAVTLQYMINRFQISVPPKLPHAAPNQINVRLYQGAQGNAPAGE
jgi:pilus assembly protein CpaB